MENGIQVPDGEAGWIENVVLASAEYCVVRASRAFELDGAAHNGTPPGLRRDRYPLGSWLYDHSHEAEADPKAEWEYWQDHVWRGYNALIDNYVQLGLASSANREEKLYSAIGGLSYDLAVLQANYVLDRGLRGDAAMRTFRDESAELLEEVTSSWRASCERLAVTFEDDTEELKGLAQPFHRVRDDLRRVLAELPAPSGHSTQEAASAERSPVSGPRFPKRASWLATRLHERSWNKHDVERNDGPNHKTVQKILNGEHVREDMLNKLAEALSAAPSSLKLPRVTLHDIPTD
jgi:hypothetical protein